jgi:hypothetical protein
MTASVVFTLGTPYPAGISQVSLQYWYVPVQATQDGAAYNPTSDTVQMAFMPQATQVPQSADWQAASWDTVSTGLLYPYAAKCLIGTGGTIALGTGQFVAYVKITDSPEIPVILAGYLEIS